MHFVAAAGVAVAGVALALAAVLVGAADGAAPVGAEATEVGVVAGDGRSGSGLA